MFYRDAEAAKVEPVNTSQEVPTQGLVSPVRRRLLQGSSLALPAILTLHSGSASAAVSVACRLKEFNALPPTGGGVVPTGVSLLTTVDTPDYVREKLGDNAVRNNDNAWIRQVIYFDHRYNVWRRADNGRYVPPRPPGSTDPGGGVISGPWYALAFFGPTGPAVALGPTRNANLPNPPGNQVQTVCVSDTCFASGNP